MRMSLRLNLNEVLKPSMKDRFGNLDGLIRFRSGNSQVRPPVNPLLARGLFLRSGTVDSERCRVSDDLFFSFSLFETRTDLEVFVLPSVFEVEGFDLRNSLCTAEDVRRNEGFQREQSSGAELLNIQNKAQKLITKQRETKHSGGK